MAVELAVLKYEDDKTHSLDCTLCDPALGLSHVTMIVYWDSVTGKSFNVCSEHMDMVVSASLARHKDELERQNPTWYLTEDEFPWGESRR